jgi:anhydro-N-acetylmuramic acid kinase
MGSDTKARLALGLISGTSMDGVDAALIRVSGPANRPVVEPIAFLTKPYPKEVRSRLMQLSAGASSTAAELSTMNFKLGEIFAAAALKVCRRCGIPPKRLAVIGSHGQTIFHQGGTSTLQIAEPAVIAERTGVVTVGDFRVADVAAGGHGAPLVPIIDYLLLREPRRNVVALNIGGISNVTVLPAGAGIEDVFGFDTGPGNMVIDALVRHFTNGRQAYDRHGRIATQGQTMGPLLTELMHNPFFRKRPPKSAGREQFGSVFASDLLHRTGWGRSPAASTTLTMPPAAKNLIRTATELTARSISGALERFVRPRADFERLVVAGGGAHNPIIMRRLNELLPGILVQTSDGYGIPVDAKEAVAFALLALRTLDGLPGNVPRVTGARHAVVLGKINRPSP